MPPKRKRRSPRPVSEADRARVRELHAKGLGRNEIARDLDRSLSVVTKIATAEGLAFDREQTKAATAAKVADTKARRAELSSLLLDDAFKLRERLWERSVQPVSTPKGPVKVWLDLPPARDASDFIRAVSGAVRSHAELEKLDSDTGAEAARSMLGALGEALQVAAGRINGTSTEPEDGSDPSHA